jgi:epoxyqueuosine reductase QueG
VDSLADILISSLRDAGLEAFGFIGPSALREACSTMPASERSRRGLDGARGAIAVALGYGEGPSEPPGWAEAYSGPLARLARFARANWYGELRARLKLASSLARARLARAGLDPGQARDWRYFVNSALPERRLALEAGLGPLGRHGLLMTEARGSAVVLGLLILPAAIGLPDSPSRPRPGPGSLHPACEGCRECVAACPTGALRAACDEGSFDRLRCLQHWSAIPGRLPPAIEAAWGDRLYGCDSCQEACPLFRPDPAARTECGPLGPGLPASWLASTPSAEVESALKGSALAMGWIPVEALKRNALLAAKDKPARGI